MSRSGERGYHHGNLRPVLIHAAMDLLQAQPPSALSLREVARRADVSHNAPYHHFRDRTELLAGVGQEAMSQFVAAQRSAWESVSEPRDAALEMAVAYVEWAVAHHGAFQVIFDPEICDPTAPSAQMAPLVRANEELQRRAVAALGGGASEVAARAAGLWAAVHGLAALVAAKHLSSDVVRPALDALLPAGTP